MPRLVINEHANECASAALVQLVKLQATAGCRC